MAVFHAFIGYNSFHKERRSKREKAGLPPCRRYFKEKPMAHKNRVLRSIETPDGKLCVDIFVRDDATYGFEEYRQDVEDGSGWFSIGYYGDRVFDTEDAALAEAKSIVVWLSRQEI